MIIPKRCGSENGSVRYSNMTVTRLLCSPNRYSGYNSTHFIFTRKNQLNLEEENGRKIDCNSSF